MNIFRASLVGASTAALFLGAAPVLAQEDTYPKGRVEFVIPSSPGGGSDQFGRLIANFAKEKGVDIRIVNIEGGGTITGVAQTLARPADGSAVVVTNAGNSTLSPAVQADMPYQVSDMTLIARAALSPVVLIVKADSPYNTADELLDAIAEDPQSFRIGTSALGGVSTFAFGGMLPARGIDPNEVKLVVFNGGGPAVTAVAGGHVEVGAQLVSEVVSMAKGGKVKALAVSGDKRIASLPDVPTSIEAGIPEFNQAGVFGIAGPANMDPAAVKYWEELVQEATTEPASVAELEAQGNVPAYLNSVDYTAWTVNEIERVRALADTMTIFD